MHTVAPTGENRQASERRVRFPGGRQGRTILRVEDASRDREAIASANRDFYAAFEALDSNRMAEVWDTEDEVLCVHPGWEGLWGRELILRSFALIFQNTRSIRFNLSDVKVRISGDAAILHCLENIVLDTGGGLAVQRVVATNGFARRAPRWRLILHHASVFERRMTAAPPSTN